MRKIYLPLLLCLAVNTQAQINAVQPVSNTKVSDVPDRYQQKIQIVFALDATGSMAGLMSAAKDKIWSIASSITQSDQPPLLEIGFVFYRDKGDAFITKRVPLSDSIDNVYAELMAITASGGGDTPESVNQGLYEAVEMFKWDADPGVFKTVILVGDAEPKMNYTDDVKYPQTCLLARSKGIVLNSILMGNNATAKKFFEKIPECSEGSFVNVDMKVNDIAIATPYDDAISDLNDKYENMALYYGDENTKMKGSYVQELNSKVVTGSKSNVKAQRAEYKMKKMEYAGAATKIKSNDLLDDISNNRISIDSIPTSELPTIVQGMSREDRKKYVESKSAERKKVYSEMQEKIKLRNQYIKDELAKKDNSAVKNSFNNIIYENLKAQAKRKNIILTGDAKF